MWYPKKYLSKIGDLCYKVIENLTIWCSIIGWKVKLPYLTEEISTQSVEGVAWFLLAAHGEMQEERD